MSGALVLEVFDETPDARFGARVAAVKSAVDPADAYMEGFAAGEAAAAARLEAAERAFLDAAAVLDERTASLGPDSERALAEALVVLVRTLFPEICRIGFGEEAAAAIARSFGGSTGAAIEIAAPPAQVEALSEALSRRRLNVGFTVIADESLVGASAGVRNGRGGLDFDLDAAREACLAALQSALHDGR